MRSTAILRVRTDGKCDRDSIESARPVWQSAGSDSALVAGTTCAVRCSVVKNGFYRSMQNHRWFPNRRTDERNAECLDEVDTFVGCFIFMIFKRGVDTRRTFIDVAVLGGLSFQLNRRKRCTDGVGLT